MRYTKLLLRNASHLSSYETGRVPVNVLLQRGYRFEFKVRGTKEPGSRGDAANDRAMCANLYAASFRVDW